LELEVLPSLSPVTVFVNSVCDGGEFTGFARGEASRGYGLVKS